MLNIRKLAFEEYENAFELVMKVFMQFEAPDYSHEGVETFKKTGIEDPEYVAMLDVYGAFLNEKLIGVIATRCSLSHIALFFVDGKYHKRGIGRKLFEYILNKSEADTITVNSSPYARKIYHHLGFSETDKEQSVMGIRFYPMIYKK